MYMYGFKYIRADLQRELLGRVQAEGIVFAVDPKGFIVVQAKDEHLRLEALRVAIDERILVEVWYFSTERLEWYQQKRDEAAAQNLAFIEYETIALPPPDWRTRPDAPSVWHSYHLAIRGQISPDH